MGKIVNGVANDYDCEQYEDWNKHLKYCQSNDPIILTRWQDPTIEEYQKEIARLKKEHKKIIDMAIHFINLHQDSKTLSLDYFDLKKLRGLLNNDKFYIKLFKDELNELKEGGKNDVKKEEN